MKDERGNEMKHSNRINSVVSHDYERGNFSLKRWF